MLTLDPTTLFYWSLSDPPTKKMKYTIESWVKTVKPNAKPASRATTSQVNSVKTRKSASTTGKRNGSTGKRDGSTGAATALMSASSRSQAAGSASVLTSDIAITDAQVPQAIKIKQDIDDHDDIYTYDGALSDREETAGVERDAAHASPIKGKKRLNSEVSIRFDMNGCTSSTSNF